MLYKLFVIFFALFFVSLPALADFNLEEKINELSEKYEVDAQKARAIIFCESNFVATSTNKNFRLKEYLTTNGDSIWIKYLWSTDLGYWQINDYYHEKTANSLGFNIYDEWEGLEYGFYLFKKEGIKPWRASKECIEKKLSG